MSVRACCKVCTGVATMHEWGLLHRDIKVRIIVAGTIACACFPFMPAPPPSPHRPPLSLPTQPANVLFKYNYAQQRFDTSIAQGLSVIASFSPHQHRSVAVLIDVGSASPVEVTSYSCVLPAVPLLTSTYPDYCAG